MFNSFFQYIMASITVIIAVYLLLRFIGKRSVNEISVFELLVIIIIGSFISDFIKTKRLDITAYNIITVGILYIVTMRFASNEKLKQNPSLPTVLVKNGDIHESGLRKSKMSVQELLVELKEKGYGKVQDVELAMMEQTGELSILPKDSQQSRSINARTNPKEIPIPLIFHGVIVEENLLYLNKDRQWLKEQLHNYPDIKHIALATYSSNGSVLINLTSSETFKE